jgi:hypothetical protein
MQASHHESNRQCLHKNKGIATTINFIFHFSCQVGLKWDMSKRIQSCLFGFYDDFCDSNMD